eukprot:1215105-Lingulodinium_polyedra.AAC.1
MPIQSPPRGSIRGPPTPPPPASRGEAAGRLAVGQLPQALREGDEAPQRGQQGPEAGGAVRPPRVRQPREVLQGARRRAGLAQ